MGNQASAIGNEINPVNLFDEDTSDGIPVQTQPDIDFLAKNLAGVPQPSSSEDGGSANPFGNPFQSGNPFGGKNSLDNNPVTDALQLDDDLKNYIATSNATNFGALTNIFDTKLDKLSSKVENRVGIIDDRIASLDEKFGDGLDVVGNQINNLDATMSSGFAGVNSNIANLNTGLTNATNTFSNGLSYVDSSLNTLTTFQQLNAMQASMMLSNLQNTLERTTDHIDDMATSVTSGVDEIASNIQLYALLAGGAVIGLYVMQNKNNK